MKAWHAWAKFLREVGWSKKQIADTLQKAPATVAWVLDENGEREVNRQANRGEVRTVPYVRRKVNGGR